MRRTLPTCEFTEYSHVLAGERGNYQWPVQYDYTDGYVRITQFDEPLTGSREPRGVVKDVILLSPVQWDALVAFVAQTHPRWRR